MTTREIAEQYVADSRRLREETEAVAAHKAAADEIDRRMSESRVKLANAMSVPAAIVVADKVVVRNLHGIVIIPIEHQP